MGWAIKEWKYRINILGARGKGTGDAEIREVRAQGGGRYLLWSGEGDCKTKS